MKLETEVTELRRNLQLAVDHKLIAEWEKQEAQDKVNKYTPDLSYIASANNIVVFLFFFFFFFYSSHKCCLKISTKFAP